MKWFGRKDQAMNYQHKNLAAGRWNELSLLIKRRMNVILSTKKFSMKNNEGIKSGGGTMRNIARGGHRASVVCGILLGFIAAASAAGPEEPFRKIVVFEKTFVNEAAQIALVKNFGAAVIKPLPLINALAVHLPSQAEAGLLRRHEVLRIDDDLVISAIAKPVPPQPAEEIPWGVDRIHATAAWPTGKGLGIKVAILDTGIDLDHLDLQANIKGHVNMISPLKSGNDDNGHGTHVAGTVAAVDNAIGVVGVGPEIYLYAVKVLSKTGSGWLSDLIEGLQWCINNKMQAVNMSLGAPADNQSFHDAIIKAYEAGIILVAAAGNNGTTGGSVDYPAKYPETIAVSAIGRDNTLAAFSSFGPEVDLAAPGVDIKSTYNNGYYKNLNGTSMAAPHMAGVAALVLTTPVGLYDLDADGVWDPAEVGNKLKATAEDLGLSANEQGAGLVRADLAVQ